MSNGAADLNPLRVQPGVWAPKLSFTFPRRHLHDFTLSLPEHTEQKAESLFWLPPAFLVPLPSFATLSLLPLVSHTKLCLPLLHWVELNYLGIKTMFASLAMVGSCASWSLSHFTWLLIMATWFPPGWEAGVTSLYMLVLLRLLTMLPRRRPWTHARAISLFAWHGLRIWRMGNEVGAVFGAQPSREGKSSLSLLKDESAWALDVLCIQSLLSQGLHPSHQFFEPLSDFPQISWMSLCKCIWNTLLMMSQRLNVKSLFRLV